MKLPPKSFNISYIDINHDRLKIGWRIWTSFNISYIDINHFLHVNDHVPDRFQYILY